MSERLLVMPAYIYSSDILKSYNSVQGQPGLKSEFQDSQGYYTEKPCLKTNKNQPPYFPQKVIIFPIKQPWDLKIQKRLCFKCI